MRPKWPRMVPDQTRKWQGEPVRSGTRSDRKVARRAREAEMAQNGTRSHKKVARRSLERPGEAAGSPKKTDEHSRDVERVF